MTTQLHYLLVAQRQRELADRAERVRFRRDAGALGTRPSIRADGDADVAITLRLANDADRTAIADLAGLDSAWVPAAPLLVAETAGEIRAAVSLPDGTIIADPFYPTSEARQLLRARAAQLRGDRRRAWPKRMFGRRKTAVSPDPVAVQNSCS